MPLRLGVTKPGLLKLLGRAWLIAQRPELAFVGRAPAGIGAIANAMTVLFTALVGFLFFGERIGTRRSVALVAGFAGVVVLASGKVWVPLNPKSTCSEIRRIVEESSTMRKRMVAPPKR